MDDGLDLLRADVMMRGQLQQHRRARRLALAHEHRFLGQGQMHPRRLHPIQGHDGAGDLAFQGVLEAGSLQGAANAEPRILLQNLETALVAVRQALGRQAQA